MTEKYKVILEGHILQGAERNQVLDQAGRIFKLDSQKALELLQGKPRTVKQNLTKQTAQRYVETISGIGMACRMEYQETLEDTPLIFSPADETTTPKICPKCSFNLKIALPESLPEECPRCGIVIRKYNADTSTETPILSDKTSAPKNQGIGVQHGDVPKNIRICAALGSLSVVGIFLCFCQPIIAFGIYFMNFNFLSHPMPDGLWARQQLMQIHGTLKIFLWVVGVMISISYYIISPMSKGGTWAQRFLNIRVVSAYSDSDPNLLAWVVRAVSSGIYLLPLFLPVVLVVLVKGEPSDTDTAICAIFFLLVNLFLLFRKDFRSLPDILSGTRQITKGGIKSHSMTSIGAIVVVFLIVAYGTVTFSLYLLTPPPTVSEADVLLKQKLALAEKNQEILVQVCDLQKMYFKKFGVYAEDSVALLTQFYNSRISNKDTLIVKVIADGILFVERTEEGFLAALPVPEPPGSYRVYTQAGDQGIKQGDFTNKIGAGRHNKIKN